MEERRSFKGYDATLKHRGFYDKEFVKYELTVESSEDIQYHFRGDNSTLRADLGVCEGRGRMFHVCAKPDPEFMVTIKMPVDGLQALVRTKRKAKKERISNVIIVSIRKDKDVQSIAKHVRKCFENLMPVHGMVKISE